MKSPVDNYAFLSIARGCGFAGLAICCAMVGLSYDPPSALKFGGFSGLLTCAVLVLKAIRSYAVAYKKTETWLILPQEYRPPAPVAQIVISGARRRALYIFARHSAAFAAFCFIGSLLLRVWIRA